MTDLYRPLGLDLAPRRPAPRVSIATLLPAAALAALVAGSALVSASQPAFRDVDVFASAPAAPSAEAPPAAVPAVTVIRPAPLAPLGRSSAPADYAAADPTLPTVTYPPGVSDTFGKTLFVRDPASLRQPPEAAAAPDEGLIEASDAGPLPVRAADGRRPFDVYQAAPATDAGTRVAIVVGGLGISQTGTMRAVRALPPAVTLAFAPAGNSLTRWMREARTGGHELLLQVPLEPQNFPDVSPGEHTLTAADAAASRFAELEWALGRLTNYVGVANYMGARLTADPEAMRAFGAELARRGLLFFDDGTSARSLARDAAREAGGVYAGADVLLDAVPEPAAVMKRLDALERTARANGQAIGVASAFDGSVEAISTWAREAEKRGVRLVPLSALASDPEAR